MGSGIATALLVGNISVVLKEVNPQFLQRGQKTIAGQFCETTVAFPFFFFPIDVWIVIFVDVVLKHQVTINDITEQH